MQAAEFMGDSPTERVLCALKSKGRRAKQGSGGNWAARCPAHHDKSASLSVRAGDDGRVLLNCHAGCSHEQIVQALGMSTEDLFPPRTDHAQSTKSNRGPITLADLAQAKRLSVEHLQALGWRDGRGRVEIPYPDRNGKVHRTRLRTAASAKDGSRWADDGQGQIAYEPDGGATSRTSGEMVVVEGETDCATLLHVGFGALGIPGASASKLIERHHVEGLRKVYYVREPDQGGEKFAEGVPARLRELGFEGQVIELRMPDGAKDPNALWCRDPDRERFAAKLREAIAAAQRKRGGIEWRGTAEIFEPLPPVEWRVRGLQIGPGRPAMLAGYGASAKTLSSQALALAVASGTPAWGHFETRRGVVRHLDYEQGWHATALRYQRLALGHGIHRDQLGDRLEAAVFPSVYLDSDGAVDAYAAACEGADLVILDALRGATPTRDENDSAIRSCLDNLGRVSERTGTTFLVLHHAGKPNDGHKADPRTILRGSSGIFDACGCIYVAVAGEEKTDPRKVSQVKQPAEASGGSVDDFALAVEDVEAGGDTTAGVRVVHREIERQDPSQAAEDKYEERARRLLDVIRRNPGAPQDTIIAKAGGRESEVRKVLRALDGEGRIATIKGERGKLTYRVEVQP